MLCVSVCIHTKVPELAHNNPTHLVPLVEVQLGKAPVWLNLPELVQQAARTHKTRHIACFTSTFTDVHVRSMDAAIEKFKELQDVQRELEDVKRELKEVKKEIRATCVLHTIQEEVLDENAV
jgi:hypothetical protein